MTIPRFKRRVRFVVSGLRASSALLVVSHLSGCFVGFDGYRLDDGSAGAGGVSEFGLAGGGRASSDEAGGAGRAGASLAGSDGELAGAPSAGGGSSGASNAGSGSTGGASKGGGANSGGGAHQGGAASGGAAGKSGVGGSAGLLGGAGTGGRAGASLVCPESHNRLSVEIPLAAGGFYCIDRAEVKNAEYKAFLDAQTDTSGQSAACAFNTSYQPDTTSAGCNQYDPVAKKNQPIACVDWCDAAAFCKWDGKHLCGKIGGGSNAPAAFADSLQSAWYRACSHAGEYDFPYGNVYDGMKCVGLDNTAVHPLAVPVTDCEGGYSGLYDMSGNVAEWEDSCVADSGAADSCLMRGGSYLDTSKRVSGAASLQCNSNVHDMPLMASKARSTRDKEIGFRCCSEPVAAP